MGLSLKLEVKPNNHVLVTNTETQEQIEVTLSFLQKVTKSSLMMLLEYKHYELILEAERHWSNLSKFQAGKEIEILKEIKLEELAKIQNIRSTVRQQEREKTAAKQKHWDEIKAYNQDQRKLREKKIAQHQQRLREEEIARRQRLKEEEIARQERWDTILAEDEALKQYINGDEHILLQSQQSYNRGLIALEYADYCLTHDYRYNFPAEINQNTVSQIGLENLSKQEQEIIALKKNNYALRERIAELEAGYIHTASDLITEATGYIVGEIII